MFKNEHLNMLSAIKYFMKLYHVGLISGFFSVIVLYIKYIIFSAAARQGIKGPWLQDIFQLYGESSSLPDTRVVKVELQHQGVPTSAFSL